MTKREFVAPGLVMAVLVLIGIGVHEATNDNPIPVPTVTPTPTVTVTPTVTPTIKPIPDRFGPTRGLATETLWVPIEVREGQPFTLDGGSRFLGGWTVSTIDGLFMVTGQLKNVSKKPIRPAIQLTFAHDTGGEDGADIVGLVQCFADLTPPGLTSTLRCRSASPYQDFNLVTAETMI